MDVISLNSPLSSTATYFLFGGFASICAIVSVMVESQTWEFASYCSFCISGLDIHRGGGGLSELA